MNIFKEAKESELKNMGYRARRFKMIWRNPKCSWNWLYLEYGIRWSDKWQLFPVWNLSDNSTRKLLFGFWKIYFEFAYNRKRNSHYLQKFPLHKYLRRTYSLLF